MEGAAWSALELGLGHQRLERKRGAAELIEEAVAAATNPTATTVAPTVGWNISRGEEVLSSGVFMRGRKW
jgi:hypothetical protein